jgi:hypothetical protein
VNGVRLLVAFSLIVGFALHGTSSHTHEHNKTDLKLTERQWPDVSVREMDPPAQATAT